VLRHYILSFNEGPPGTGKTALIVAVANYINTELFPIKLIVINRSCIMSKWVCNFLNHISNIIFLSGRGSREEYYCVIPIPMPRKK